VLRISCRIRSLAIVSVELLLKVGLSIDCPRALIGALNSRLQCAHTAMTGVELSHFTTLSLGWFGGVFFPLMRLRV
jgi:hypothetical protein